MTKPQQRKLVELMNDAKDYLQSQKGFMADVDLKAAFVIVSTAEAALMFSSTQSLAKVCADWCESEGKGAIERN